MKNSPPNYDKNHPKSICRLFSSIATNYDRANSVLSWQMHRRWNSYLVDSVVEASRPQVMLDLCCGTGDIAFNYLSRVQGSKNAPAKVYMLDFCQEMLDCAKAKSTSLQLAAFDLEYMRADAHVIPLPDQSVDCVTMAYGIRNVRDPLQCAKEVRRVLRPGGSFGILELTRPVNPLLRLGHQLYLKTLLPVLGRLVTSNQDAYQYLCQSIHTFIPPAELEGILQAGGFCQTWRKSLTGGIATVLCGRK